MNKKIAVIKDEELGSEVIGAAIEVLDTIAKKYGHRFEYVDLSGEILSCAEQNLRIPSCAVEKCLSVDGILFGVSDEKKARSSTTRFCRENALRELADSLQLYAEVRPIKIYPALKDLSPLKNNIVKDGLDFVIVKETTGGIYNGEKGIRRGSLGREAYDVERYSEIEIERVARVAFELAEKRKCKLTSVDKADRLESSRLWRYAIHEVAQDYPNVEVTDLFVNECAAKLLESPNKFDVILTNGFFGDALLGVANALTGCAAILPSALVNDSLLGLYSPACNSLPYVAKNIANPIGAILSAKTMLDDCFDMHEEATNINNAVTDVINAGYCTVDICSNDVLPLSTQAITNKIIERLK